MSSDLDIVPKYSSKAGAYERYRWPYDRQAIEKLLDKTSLPSAAVVADCGSGTGMSSLPFLEAGCHVYGVELNAAMRQAAERILAGEKRFQSIDGRAENCGLEDDSVDLIVVGRALHWFPQAKTRQEFARISKRDGWLAIMAVKHEDDALLDAVRSVSRVEYGWDVQSSKFNRQVEPLTYFFEGGVYDKIRTRQVVRENWTQFLGRVTSMSTAPDTDHDFYRRFEGKLREIFDVFQQDGEIQIRNTTQIVFGHPWGCRG